MRLGPPRRPRRVTDLLNPAAALLPAANVIMQLASPGVGYGVLESPVDSGNVYKHPFKRARTTGTYLAAATMGTDADRALLRAQIDKVHALVRSRASSPVSYNAFDPRLQLWVAACLYRYYIDMHEFLYGPLDEESADAIYADARALGTTLQVRDDMWPEDRDAFDTYWKQSLQDLQIDPPVREHLYGVATFAFLAFLPAPLRLLAGRFNLFTTTGFLPAEFRSHMQLRWTAGQQQRFERLLTGLRVADRVIPHEVWLLGYQIYLWDMRIRDRLGKRVV
ncbi:oxygenase MpaB family protein [Mycobacterium sp. NPDC050441]|uniref:oxygenase MpaB family protein n=1 Tax=Mycobacterium sp. NPDC050441 TaxID=3155403 RepID=UPI0033D4BDFA